MTKTDSRSDGAPADSSREQRLAKALRENLRRRKAPKPAPAPTEKPGG